MQLSGSENEWVQFRSLLDWRFSVCRYDPLPQSTSYPVWGRLNTINAGGKQRKKANAVIQHFYGARKTFCFIYIYIIFLYFLCSKRCHRSNEGSVVTTLESRNAVKSLLHLPFVILLSFCFSISVSSFCFCIFRTSTAHWITTITVSTK